MTVDDTRPVIYGSVAIVFTPQSGSPEFVVNVFVSSTYSGYSFTLNLEPKDIPHTNYYGYVYISSVVPYVDVMKNDTYTVRLRYQSGATLFNEPYVYSAPLNWTFTPYLVPSIRFIDGQPTSCDNPRQCSMGYIIDNDPRGGYKQITFVKNGGGTIVMGVRTDGPQYPSANIPFSTEVTSFTYLPFTASYFGQPVTMYINSVVPTTYVFPNGVYTVTWSYQRAADGTTLTSPPITWTFQAAYFRLLWGSTDTSATGTRFLSTLPYMLLLYRLVLKDSSETYRTYSFGVTVTNATLNATYYGDQPFSGTSRTYFFYNNPWLSGYSLASNAQSATNNAFWGVEGATRAQTFDPGNYTITISMMRNVAPYTRIYSLPLNITYWPRTLPATILTPAVNATVGIPFRFGFQIPINPDGHNMTYFATRLVTIFNSTWSVRFLLDEIITDIQIDPANITNCKGVLIITQILGVSPACSYGTYSLSFSYRDVTNRATLETQYSGHAATTTTISITVGDVNATTPVTVIDTPASSSAASITDYDQERKIAWLVSIILGSLLLIVTAAWTVACCRAK